MEIKVILTSREAQERFDRGKAPAVADYLNSEDIGFDYSGKITDDTTGDEVGTWEVVRA